jgi:hypothetical protein
MIQKFRSYVRQYAFQVALMSMLVPVIGVGVSDAMHRPLMSIAQASPSLRASKAWVLPKRALLFLSERTAAFTAMPMTYKSGCGASG